MMFLNVLVVALALCTQTLSARRYYQTLSVHNGAPWGHWHGIHMCPGGTFAGGFSMRVEGHQGGDNTAVNGIRLHCVKNGREYGTVTSHAGHWGHWTPVKWCRSGVLKRFWLMVESPQGGGDDTAVNNIQFVCSRGHVIWGFGMPWGRWGRPSRQCRSGRGGICGITTKVEGRQGWGDDTALNDVRFVCCR